MRYQRIAVAGIAVVAVLAMAAPASAAEFHSETAHTELFGSQIGTDVFTFNTGTVKCNSITYSGTSSSTTTEEVRLTPTFSECTAFGFVSTSVHPDNCSMKVGYRSFTIELTCGFIVTAWKCFVKVAAQVKNKLGTWINQGIGAARRWINRWQITGLTYTQESKSFPGCTNGTFTDGSWYGEAEVRGTNTAGSSVGIWYE